MAGMEPSVTPDIPDHVGETAQALGRLHADHESSATLAERGFQILLNAVGRAAFAGVLTLFVAGWTISNLFMGRSAFDPPYFSLLDTLLSLFAVYMTVIILVVQRRSQKLGDHREQLMLQLAMLSDQKNSKLIALIEEMRRDDPMIRNRDDRRAEELTRTVDPQVMMQAIREVNEQPPSE